MAAASTIEKGTLVRCQYDTGALGFTTLYGVVVKCGAKTYTVKWESGLRNRVAHGHKDILPLGPRHDDVPARLREEATLLKEAPVKTPRKTTR